MSGTGSQAGCHGFMEHAGHNGVPGGIGMDLIAP